MTKTYFLISTLNIYMHNFYVWMEDFAKKQMQKANDTYHHYGFGSSLPFKPVLKLILKYLQKHPKAKVLDYGAGKDPLLTKMLKSKGFNTTAHDFGVNQTSNHDKQALNSKYDLVIATNVLNVQQDKTMLNKALEQIKDVLVHNGTLIATFPKLPNETGITQKEFKEIFKLHFGIVKFKNLNSDGIIAKAKV